MVFRTLRERRFSSLSKGDKETDKDRKIVRPRPRPF